jgi:hypothetical protein
MKILSNSAITLTPYTILHVSTDNYAFFLSVATSNGKRYCKKTAYNWLRVAEISHLFSYAYVFTHAVLRQRRQLPLRPSNRKISSIWRHFVLYFGSIKLSGHAFVNDDELCKGR